MTTRMTKKSGYESYDGTRKELIDIVDRLGGVVETIGQHTLVKTVDELRERVAGDTFQVLFLGAFNAGKSTMINAMLGDQALPSGGEPTTGVLSTVRWADSARAVLYPLDRQSVGGLDMAHPFPADVADLERHITACCASREANKWGMAEVYWPLEICRLGVNIVDSPGFDSDADQSEITLRLMNKADAVVFVFSALQALTSAERAVVDHDLRMFKHANMFAVVNRINELDDDDEDDDRAEVLEDLRGRMKEYWALCVDRVTFVNAGDALKGRQQGTPQLVIESGLPEFEQKLEDFLTEDRGRLKIVPPATQVQRIVHEARSAIDGVFTLLDKTIEDLTAVYERQIGPLSVLREERLEIGRSIENHMADTRSQVEEAARQMLVAAADSCPDWAQEIDRENKATYNPIKMRNDAAAATAEEIGAGLSDRILQHAEDWHRGQLADMVAARMSDLEQQVGDRLAAFDARLDEIRSALLSAGGSTDQCTPAGAQAGSTIMVRELIAQPVLAMGLALTGFGPGALVTAVFKMSAFKSPEDMSRFNDQIVDAVAAGVATKLRDEAADIARAVADQVHAELDRQRLDVDHRLAAPIAALHEQVQFALAQRDRTKESSGQERSRLAAHRQALDEVDRRAAAIVDGWARAMPG
jgi:hypothetical protein